MLTSNQRDILASMITDLNCHLNGKNLDVSGLIEDYERKRDFIEKVCIAMENEDGRDKNSD